MLYLACRCITANGPAIWGGCVPEYSGWRAFCRPGTIFIEHYACRGTSLIGAGKLSRYRIFIGSTGPEVSGVQAVSEPETCHGAGIILWADARVRVQEPLPICLEGRSKSKKHDKQLTHIVRVSLSDLFLSP